MAASQPRCVPQTVRASALDPKGLRQVAASVNPAPQWLSPAARQRLPGNQHLSTTQRQQMRAMSVSGRWHPATMTPNRPASSLGQGTQAFDLNIEKVLEHWTIPFAIRELIANALDEQALTGTAE